MQNDENALNILKKALAVPDTLETVAKAVAQAGAWASWTLERQLWYLRKRAKMTQGQLSIRSEISQARLSQLETGGDAKISTLERLFATLGHGLLIVPAPLDAKREGRPTRSIPISARPRAARRRPSAPQDSDQDSDRDSDGG